MEKFQKERLTIENFLEIYSVSRSSFFSHVRRGNLKIIKDGTRTFIRRSDAEVWLANQGQQPT